MHAHSPGTTVGYSMLSMSPESPETSPSHARAPESRTLFRRHSAHVSGTISSTDPGHFVELFGVATADEDIIPDISEVQKNQHISVSADGPNACIVTSHDLMSGGQDAIKSDSETEAASAADRSPPLFFQTGHSHRRSDVPPEPWHAATPVPEDIWAANVPRTSRLSVSSGESPTSSRSPRGSLVQSPDLPRASLAQTARSPPEPKPRGEYEPSMLAENASSDGRVQSAPMLQMHSLLSRAPQSLHHRRRSLNHPRARSLLAPRSLYVGAGMAVLGTSANRRFDDGFYMGDHGNAQGLSQHLQRPFTRSFSVDTGTSHFSHADLKPRHVSDSDSAGSVSSRSPYFQKTAMGDPSDYYSGDSSHGDHLEHSLAGEDPDGDSSTPSFPYPTDDPELSEQIMASRPAGPAKHPGPIGGGGILGPAPLRRKSAVKVDIDEFGIPWIEFEYTRDRIKWLYRCRTDVTAVDVPNLATSFKSSNCVYPGAMVPPEEYTGHRQHYEQQCNELGWRLSWLNPVLRQRRGLIQRAVDSYRNTSSDPSVRSRRARRLARAKP